MSKITNPYEACMALTNSPSIAPTTTYLQDFLILGDPIDSIHISSRAFPLSNYFDQVTTKKTQTSLRIHFAKSRQYRNRFHAMSSASITCKHSNCWRMNSYFNFKTSTSYHWLWKVTSFEMTLCKFQHVPHIYGITSALAPQYAICIYML